MVESLVLKVPSAAPPAPPAPAGLSERSVLRELVHALEISQPKISRHMATMRDAEIVQPRRHAQWVFYGINPELENWQKRALSAAGDSISDEPAAMNDSRRLAEMQERPERCNAA